MRFWDSPPSAKRQPAENDGMSGYVDGRMGRDRKQKSPESGEKIRISQGGKEQINPEIQGVRQMRG